MVYTDKSEPIFAKRCYEWLGFTLDATVTMFYCHASTVYSEY